MKNVFTFSEFINEGELPQWAKPNGNYSNRGWLAPNFAQYQDIRQSMTRFNVGEQVVETTTGICGTIISFGDGMNTITWKDNFGLLRASYPNELDPCTF